MQDTHISKVDLRLCGKTYSIFSLTGEESLYKPFLFNLTLLIPIEQSQTSWLLETAELLLPDKTITGIITEESIAIADQQKLLKITCVLEPRFVLLRHQFLAKMFLNKTLKDVFTDTVLSAGYTPAQIQWSTQYPENHPYLFQVPQESDHDFLTRLFSNEHYFYYFDEGKIYATNQNTNTCLRINYSVQQPTGPQGEGQSISYHTVKESIKNPASFAWLPVCDPAIPLLLSAHIESESLYAQLDEAGNYTHRLKMDESKQNYTQAMPALKKLSPYSQLHFPLRDQAEILVAYLYGFSHEPFIMGSVHNSEHISPVTSKNHTQHILKSPSGNLLYADDNPSHFQWLVQNPQSENYVLLNATTHTLQLYSQGNIIFNAHSNIMPSSTENTIEKTGHQFLQIAEYQFTSLTQSGNLFHHAQTDYLYYAKNNMLLHSGHDLMINSEGQFILHAEQSIQIITNSHVFSIAATSGKLIISTGKDIHILGNGEENIRFTNGSAAIEITHDGNITIQAEQIGVTGQPLFSVMPS